MTEADLRRIEQALGLALPSAYRAVMQQYPVGPDSVAQDCAMPDDADRVIEQNLGYREHGFFGAAWPEQYFAFGHNGFGDPFYLDVSLAGSPVFCAQHDSGAFVQESPSLEAWIADLAREEDEEAHRLATKKWWQFWIS